MINRSFTSRYIRENPGNDWFDLNVAGMFSSIGRSFTFTHPRFPKFVSGICLPRSITE